MLNLRFILFTHTHTLFFFIYLPQVDLFPNVMNIMHFGFVTLMQILVFKLSYLFGCAAPTCTFCRAVSIWRISKFWSLKVKRSFKDTQPKTHNRKESFLLMNLILKGLVLIVLNSHTWCFRNQLVGHLLETCSFLHLKSFPFLFLFSFVLVFCHLEQ